MRLPTTPPLRRLARAAAATVAGAALAACAAAPAAHAGQDFVHQLASVQQFAVAPNATQTFRMDIQRLHENENVLQPCWGFELHGPGGIDVVAADLPPTGYVAEEWADIDDEEGGRIGVERRPDGTFYIGRPQPLADSMIRGGLACASVGWRTWTPQGTPTLDPFGQPLATSVGARAARAGRARANRLRVAMRKLRRRAKGRARAAQLGPVEVVSAELNVPVLGEEPDIVVTLRTGAIPPGTVLTTRATVLQQGPNVPQLTAP